MKDMKIIFLLLPFALLVACGPKAEQKEAEKAFFEEQTEGAQSLSGLSFEDELRSGSLVIYPTETQVKDYSYQPEGEALEQWEQFLALLDYGDQVPREISPTLPADMKISKLSVLEFSALDARNFAFRKIHNLRKELETLPSQAEETLELNQQIEELPCFYDEITVDNPLPLCHANQSDSFINRRVLRSCAELEAHAFMFKAEELEEKERYHELVNACAEYNEFNQPDNERGQKETEIKALEERFEAATQAVSVMFKDLEKHTGAVHFVSVGSQEAAADQSSQSTIQVDPQTGEVQAIKLWLDLGENYSEGAGLREFSTENELIQSVELVEENQVTLLKFTLTTKDFELKARLSATVQDVMGLRFVGGVRVTDKNGESRRGQMRLELNQIAP